MKTLLITLSIVLALSCNVEPTTPTSICQELLNERSQCINRLYNASSFNDQNNMKEQIIRVDTMLIKCNCNNQVDTLTKPVQ